ncbi:hypothetical protein K0M31_008767 [Melipona bicolor]|uniref:Uncharacterized protein n=1 Tax=Melipona bicolor TaxID=60889 RepID=A0AA40KJW0_9HYME|nr:hypothetical protein K0M31_008767 [Melipona bicolor]
MKRGAEKETVAQLSPELYAPKTDAKDSYSASFGASHPRDSYYPNYNPYSKITSPSNYAYYGTSLPYSYQSSPYSTYNPYSTLHGTYNPPYSSHTVPPPPPPPPPPSSYPAIPYSPSYPNYYYQSPYYYPDYYNQPLFHPPPLPPPAIDYSGDAYNDVETGGKSKDRKLGEEAPQFIDGGNYISANPKDLESQPSTYKTSSFQNQLEQTGNMQILKGIPIPVPKTTYRVISVAGQPVGPDYPLPASYVKAQQLEELMNHGLVKLLQQNLQQVPEYSVRESTKDAATTANDGQDANQNDQSKSTRYVTIPNAIAKTGLTYVVTPSILRKLNVAGQAALGQKTQLKNIKYPPLTPGVYTAIEKPEQDQTESNEYEKYESYERTSQDAQDDYDGSSSQITDKRQQQSYEVNSGQSYQNQNFVTPRAYTYQYTSYNPTQTTSQRQSQLYKNNLDSVNFGVKTKEA